MSLEEISRNALRIYIKLVESEKPLGVRELARELNLPVSTVHYSLRRLEEMDLVKRSGDGYVAKKIIAPEGFLVIRRKLVPRLLIYSAFFIGVLISESILIAATGHNPDRVVVIITSLAASAILLIEGLYIRKRYS